MLQNMMNQIETSRHGRFFHAFVVDLCMALECQVHAQSEMFGVAQTLYILNRGLVSRPPRLHRQGAVWGADFVLKDLYLLDSWECMALTYCEVTTLSRDTFFKVVAKQRLQHKAVVGRVRRLVCWLAVQRAMMREARRRLQIKEDGGDW